MLRYRASTLSTCLYHDANQYDQGQRRLVPRKLSIEFSPLYGDSSCALRADKRGKERKLADGASTFHRVTERSPDLFRLTRKPDPGPKKRDHRTPF